MKHMEDDCGVIYSQVVPSRKLAPHLWHLPPLQSTAGLHSKEKQTPVAQPRRKTSILADWPLHIAGCLASRGTGSCISSSSLHWCFSPCAAAGYGHHSPRHWKYQEFGSLHKWTRQISLDEEAVPSDVSCSDWSSCRSSNRRTAAARVRCCWGYTLLVSN